MFYLIMKSGLTTMTHGNTRKYAIDYCRDKEPSELCKNPINDDRNAITDIQ